MNRKGFGGRRDSMDWFFDRVFPKLVIGIFVTVIAVFVIQFAFIAWGTYHLVTDPEYTARTIGTVIGEALRPVADAVRGE